jgi:RNA polymerase sigma factor (sigma-70 family)
VDAEAEGGVMNLILLAQSGDRDAMALVIAEHERMIYCEARALVRPGIEIRDLMQAGRVGVMLAVSRYEVDAGSFATFARKWAHGEIVMACRRSDDVSLDALDESGCALMDTIADSTAEQAFASLELSTALRKAIALLDRMETAILERRQAGETLAQIGRDYGGSKDWTRARQNGAIAKLRKVVK